MAPKGRVGRKPKAAQAGPGKKIQEEAMMVDQNNQQGAEDVGGGILSQKDDDDNNTQVVQKPKGKKGKKRGKKNVESYKSYIYRVLKQVFPNGGISMQGMQVMNSFVEDMFDRIAREAQQLAHFNKKSTIATREIESAVRLALCGQLADHAITEGRKAIQAYTQAPQ